MHYLFVVWLELDTVNAMNDSTTVRSCFVCCFTVPPVNHRRGRPDEKHDAGFTRFPHRTPPMYYDIFLYGCSNKIPPLFPIFVDSWYAVLRSFFWLRPSFLKRREKCHQQSSLSLSLSLSQRLAASLKVVTIREKKISIADVSSSPLQASQSVFRTCLSVTSRLVFRTRLS